MVCYLQIICLQFVIGPCKNVHVFPYQVHNLLSLGVQPLSTQMSLGVSLVLMSMSSTCWLAQGLLVPRNMSDLSNKFSNGTKPLGILLPLVEPSKPLHHPKSHQ
jgi:hypothetical protein